MSLGILAQLKEQKKSLQCEICRAGRPFEEQVRLLIGIRGVTPLLALGFLSEVGDIGRFRSLRGLLAYLGVVPTVRASGGTTRVGHINPRSRGLVRTLPLTVVTWSILSPQLGRFPGTRAASRVRASAHCDSAKDLCMMRLIYALQHPVSMEGGGPVSKEAQGLGPAQWDGGIEDSRLTGIIVDVAVLRQRYK